MYVYICLCMDIRIVPVCVPMFLSVAPSYACMYVCVCVYVHQPTSRPISPYQPSRSLGPAETTARTHTQNTNTHTHTTPKTRADWMREARDFVIAGLHTQTHTQKMNESTAADVRQYGDMHKSNGCVCVCVCVPVCVCLCMCVCVSELCSCFMAICLY